MKYFKPSEIKYYEKVSPLILVAVDKFRELCRAPVYISPVEGATWREHKHGSTSYHCCIPGRNTQSLALDIFPTAKPFDAFMAALSVPEINGIGLYPTWKYKELKFGMHLDVRPGPRVLWWSKTPNNFITIHSFQQFQSFIQELQ